MNITRRVDLETTKPIHRRKAKPMLFLAVAQACLCCLLLILPSAYAFADLSQHELAQLRQKAEQGDAEAQFRLGDYFEKQEKRGEAIVWWRRAAEQGNCHSMVTLGVKLMLQGTHKECWQGMKWFQAALEYPECHAHAAYSIGYRYLVGWKNCDLPPDLDQATKWFERAVDDPNIGRLIGACTGMLHHIVNIRLHDGRSSVRDYAEAFRISKNLSNKGDNHSMYLLGVIHRDGLGVKRDYRKAAEWFLKAAEKGNEKAKKALKEGGVEQ